jgi:hypothetical protein
MKGIKFVETTLIPNEEQTCFLEYVLSNYMPWFLQKEMFATQKNKCPFLSHTLRDRPIYSEPLSGAPNSEPLSGAPNSELMEVAENLFHELASKTGVKVDKVLRAAFNLTLHSEFADCGKHIDHDFPHNNFLFYLNECSNGETIIYKDDVIVKEIKPVQHKAVFFSGEPHAMRFCGDGEYRVVLVVTFLGEIP